MAGLFSSRKKSLAAVLALALVPLSLAAAPVSAATEQQSQSVGIQGEVPGPPPSQAPVISSPGNGQSFTSTPINVSGLCQTGLLVEIFKNNVFAGSTECSAGSFKLQIDLFSGSNQLIARQYDALNQASPDSNTVTVTYVNPSISVGSQLILTSQYSKRGADPGSVLTWPLSLSGGSGPYAISVDWGDNAIPEVVSLPAAGNFNIEHTYKVAGTYTVTIEATDVNSSTAFLQVVGVANGPVQQTAAGAANTTTVIKEQPPWWVYLGFFILVVCSFWFGKQHQLELIRARLRRGERPFK